jgi:hypothetical protein
LSLASGRIAAVSWQDARALGTPSRGTRRVEALRRSAPRHLPDWPAKPDPRHGLPARHERVCRGHRVMFRRVLIGADRRADTQGQDQAPRPSRSLCQPVAGDARAAGQNTQQSLWAPCEHGAWNVACACGAVCLLSSVTQGSKGLAGLRAWRCFQAWAASGWKCPWRAPLVTFLAIRPE